jgi:hypothetical protein
MSDTIPYLRPISVATPLMLDALDGASTLARATDVFAFGIEQQVQNIDNTKWGTPTQQQSVCVFEQVRDGSFSHMFGSFGRVPEELSLTQSQIVNFCTLFPQWLSPSFSGSTFFLLRSEDRSGVRSARPILYCSCALIELRFVCGGTSIRMWWYMACPVLSSSGSASLWCLVF